MRERLIKTFGPSDMRGARIYQFDHFWYRVWCTKQVRAEYPEMWYTADFFYETEEEALSAATNWFEHGTEPPETLFHALGDRLWCASRDLNDTLEKYAALLPQLTKLETQVRELNGTIVQLKEKVQLAQSAIYELVDGDKA